MEVEIITKQDLESFGAQLLAEIRKMLSQTKNERHPEWLKSYEVRKLLKISPGTLQNLRVNGTLRYTKIGGIIYYSSDDIKKVLEGNLIDKKVDKKTGQIKAFV